MLVGPGLPELAHFSAHLASAADGFKGLAEVVGNEVGGGYDPLFLLKMNCTPAAAADDRPRSPKTSFRDELRQGTRRNRRPSVALSWAKRGEYSRLWPTIRENERRETGQNRAMLDILGAIWGGSHV